MQNAKGISEGTTNSTGSHREFHKGRGELKVHLEERIEFASQRQGERMCWAEKIVDLKSSLSLCNTQI